MKKILLVFLLLPFFAQAQIITTIAGTGISGYSGDGGLPIDAQLSTPSGIAIDKNDDVYIADLENYRFRKIDGATNIMSTVAGTGIRYCDTLNGVPATSFSFFDAGYVATDDSGNFYTSSCFNNSVKKVNVGNGIINTLIGAYATISIVDDSGNLYMADGASKIYKRIFGTNTTSLIAGNGTIGNSGDGSFAVDAELDQPTYMAISGDSILYIDDGGNTRIRNVNLITGIITAFAGTGSLGYSGDGHTATDAEFSSLAGIAVGPNGDVYIADAGNNVVRKVTVATGIITTFAGNGIPGYSGDGGLATSAQLNSPQDVKVDTSGDVYIADAANNRIRKITYSPTSINNITGLPIINIYPNPTQNVLTITAADKITNVTISNLLGQTVYTRDFNVDKAEIDITNLPKGVYFAKINGTIVRKFVKE